MDKVISDLDSRVENTVRDRSSFLTAPTACSALTPRSDFLDLRIIVLLSPQHSQSHHPPLPHHLSRIASHHLHPQFRLPVRPRAYRTVHRPSQNLGSALAVSVDPSCQNLLKGLRS